MPEVVQSQVVQSTTGRPGMTLWSILVGGVLRLDLNADDDRLHELINQYKTLRELLEHSLYDDDKKYLIKLWWIT